MKGLLVQKQASCWQFEGELVMHNIAKMQKKLHDNVPQEGAWQLDCHKVNAMDTSGLAYLVECVAHSQRQSLAISIKGLNDENLSSTLDWPSFYKV
jgi:Predicted NTP binding protein (contains STAS domain)